MPNPTPAPTRPRMSKAAPSRARMRRVNPVAAALVAAAVVLLLVLAYILQDRLFDDREAMPSGGQSAPVTEIAPTTPVRINEIMSSNGSAWSDEKGNFGDWVELYNSSATETVDIGGWILTDTQNALNGFTFPSMSLAPGEFVLVFCDGTLKNTPGYTFHAPFKLSSDGDMLLLFNKAQVAVEAVNIPGLSRNVSYARVGNSWTTTSAYTPGMPNEEEYHRLMKEALSDGQGAGALAISELMADNKTYVPDEEGLYWDWVEIHNTSSQTVELEGYCLSDDPSNPTKWRFPKVSLEADGYLLVYCSGMGISEAGRPLHAGFKLASEGETVVLSDASGRPLSSVSYENMKTDRSLSLYEGSYTRNLAPTPGGANTPEQVAAVDAAFAAQNLRRVYINEVSAGTSRTVDGEGLQPEWLEIVNRSGETVDLSGWGLSDNANRPRKWQFPNGAQIAPGEYLLIKLGTEGKSLGSYEAGFGVSLLTGAEETLTLCTPDGVIVDRMPLPVQYASISYGRQEGKSGFFYMPKPTPGARNHETAYPLRTEAARASLPGGLYDAAVTVELSAPEGATIRYTTDGAAPTSSSPVYEGPLTLSDTTVLRTRVWRDGEYPSPIATQTFFVGVSHTMNVMSLVMDPADLWSQEKGLYVLGPHALEQSPYGSIDRGANFWMTWEKTGSIEYYGTNGETLLHQGAGIRLHGQYSRSEPQKAFKVIARAEYGGDNRFRYPLFSKRDYTEYQSFVLRSSGSDGDKTRMRDSLLTSLAENLGVMYQETELCVVYLNGQYWGQYNLRERINAYSVCQWEGWTDPANVDLVKANSNVLQGSDESYQAMLTWVKKNGIKNEAAYEKVCSVVDIENFIDYICLEMWTGNTDTLNVKRYRNAVEGDGKWRWIFFDLDWAFYTDTNSVNRWVDPKGMGNSFRTDNALFVALMKYEPFYDRFLTRLGQLMATDLTTRNVVDKVNERLALLKPEMPMHMEAWQSIVVDWLDRDVDTLPRDVLKRYKFDNSKWKSELSDFVRYAEQRPGKLFTYLTNEKNTYFKPLTKAQMEKYFGAAMAADAEYKASKQK